MNWRGTIQECGATPIVVADGGGVLTVLLWALIA